MGQFQRQVPAQSAPYSRAVSASERLYLASQQDTPPFAIQTIIESRDAVDLPRLCQAVATAAVACPGASLRCFGTAWRDTGAPPPVHCDRGTDALLHSAVLRRPLDPWRGPTCEVVVRRGPHGTQVIFRALHGVMDGRGVLLWIRNVLRAWRGEPCEAATATLTEGDLCTPRQPDQGVHGTRRLWRSPLTNASLDGRHYLWARRTVPGRHAALVAKLATGIVHHSGAGARFMVPVDLRRHAAQVRSTGNLSMPVFLEVGTAAPWEDIHAALLEALHAQRERQHDGAARTLTRMPLWLLRGALRGVALLQGERYLSSGILSHLGRVDLADISAPGFAADTLYSLPVHSPLAPLSLVAVECAQHVELTLACPQGPDMAARADALLAALADRLAPAVPVALQVPLAGKATVPALFAERASATPHAVALVDGPLTQTYGALQESVHAHATLLRQRGVGVGERVAIWGERSAASIAALLGVLQCGAAYVPIEPQYPDDRIAFMLRDSASVLLFGPRSAALRLHALGGDRVAYFEDAVGGAAPTVEPPAASPGDVAYVIYTSGSTGQPKGVQIEHHSIVDYVTWATAVYDIDKASRFGLFTSMAFDLTVTALFAPLLAGGSVGLCRDPQDLPSLRHMCEGAQVNCLKLTPTHLTLLHTLGIAARDYRTLIVGGEVLDSALARTTAQRFGAGCAIFNEYGPTEATVGCTAHRFDAAGDTGAAVPVGLPRDSTRVVVLDEALEPCPPGTPGEICIAGPGLMRGYLGRADLDAQVNITLVDGRRAYRSGDVGVWRDDGILEFLGRRDAQIKLRGQRIEPAEVEAALLRHPHVERARVLARRRPGSESVTLCAYWCGAPVPEEQLRAALGAWLPTAMVPGYICQVSAFPMTPYGKLDVDALPLPGALSSAGLDDATAATTDSTTLLEDALRTMWGDALGISPNLLTPYQDFYRLGGDSLTLLQLVTTVAKTMLSGAHPDLFMRQMRPILARPTLHAMGQIVTRLRTEIST